MFDLRLSPEQLEIRDTVREFVTQEIKPGAIAPARLEAAQRTLPRAELEKASEMGLRALGLPEELGGADADTLTACLVAEELAAGDVTLAAILTETSTLARVLFGTLMSDPQRERFLAPFLEDAGYHLSYADHEAATDTALGVNYHRPVVAAIGVATTATQDAKGDWVLHGKKSRVANAPLAGLFAVKAKADPQASGTNGVAVFLVERGAPGLTVRDSETGPERQHGATGDLILQNCRVASSQLLRPEAARVLDVAVRNAPQTVAMNIGLGRAAYEAALDYVQLRVQGGRRLVEHQAIGTRLADIAIRLEAARATLRQAAWAADNPEAVSERSVADLPLQAMARVFAAETVYQVAKDAAECFGAMGVMRDMPLQKYIGDALTFLHAHGGQTEAKLRIAERLAGYDRPLGGAAAIAAE